jgi:DNA repair protein SbcC/Rad50
MRPVLLEMKGFTSYRTEARIDFRDADFFVLMGPTGSGKSTVIDAMVFALYGTVPRWDNRSAVAPALAPTVNSGVVRLIFDAGGKRYTALRDVRRGSGRNPTVTVREARLEQFVSSDAVGDPDDEIVPLATGRDVSGTVEQILGLNFEQFTQSVTLPQGEFARFLHATDAERQAILKNLLGYGVYDHIQRAAYSRASDADTRAETLTEHLNEYADATPEQVESRLHAFEELRRVREHVQSTALPALKSAFEAAATARVALEKVASEQQLLSGVTRPDGVDNLETQKRTAIAEFESAGTAQRTIEQQDSQIRGALKQSRPRHELEQMLGNWRELGELGCRLPDLAATAEAADAAHRQAAEARDTAEQAAGAARATANQETRLTDELVRQLETARSHFVLVGALAAPDDITVIAEGLRQADDALSEARNTLTDCESAQQAVLAELDELPSPTLLSGAVGSADQVQAIITQDGQESADRGAAERAVGAAHEAAESAVAGLVTAEQALRDAEHADQAAALRADLHTGDDCPVCGQHIAELPSDAGEVDLDTARLEFKNAKADADQATAEAARAHSEQQRAAAVREERMKHCDTVRPTLLKHLTDLGLSDALHALADPIDPDALAVLSADTASVQRLVAEAVERRTSLDENRHGADAAVAAARGDVGAKQAALDDAQRQSRQAHSALHTARDTVSVLSPPGVGDADIGAAWQQLMAWAQDQKDSLAGDLESLAPRAQASRAAAEHAQQQLQLAETKAGTARSAFTESALAKQKADTELGSAQNRTDTLSATLAEAPPQAAAGAELDRVKALEQQHDDLGSQLDEARTAMMRAQEAMAAAEAAITKSWEQLRRVRDPLVGLNAPTVSGTDMVVSWDQLVGWAAAEAQARSAQITAVEMALRDAETRTDTAASALTAELSKHGVEMSGDITPADLAERVPAALAAAVATAEGALCHAQERVQQAEKMQAEVTASRESAEVARMLSNLMRANQFPRWLIAGALDALLQDASSILLELSGGQFELTRDERDLLVIDHNDADMARPVKTLSGGETFQASLALALALSEQVTALSAAGASKLESIFLDEGFGTLDEVTLDVVAATLENLAASGSRMVGVITHVAALAERIPVRFQVTRDSTGSHIERSTA